jgi:guanine nucleotide-exchange factor
VWVCVYRILEKICNDPQMLADMFINYDCDPETVDLFERMVNSLSRLAQGTHNVDPNSAVFAQTTTINASSLRVRDIGLLLLEFARLFHL